jgi:ADP-ribose pyrophosphatase YjhB (NUDIX family)
MVFTPSFCPRCATPMASADDHGTLRPTCPQCGYVWYRNPVPAAGVVLVEHGRVLLVKRRWDPRAGAWCLPAGFMEAGETPEQSAIRELEEEDRADRAAHRALRRLRRLRRSARARRCSSSTRGSRPAGTLRAGDDAIERAWYPLDALPDDLAFASHRQALTELIERLATR